MNFSEKVGFKIMRLSGVNCFEGAIPAIYASGSTKSAKRFSRSILGAPASGLPSLLIIRPLRWSSLNCFHTYMLLLLGRQMRQLCEK